MPFPLEKRQLNLPPAPEVRYSAIVSMAVRLGVSPYLLEKFLMQGNKNILTPEQIQNKEFSEAMISSLLQNLEVDKFS